LSYLNIMDRGGYDRAGMRLPNIQVRTEEIKEIVQGLNSQPYGMGMTLVSFDEKSPEELLALLREVITRLDTQPIDLKEDQGEGAYKLTEFLKVLSYPSNFDSDFQRGLASGDKKYIYPVLHFILTRLPQMQQRAYLGRFLSNVYVPEDILIEDDMKIAYQEYKELQAQFQVVHQELEQQRLQALPPHELKKNIDQLEQEKEQLVTKISRLKAKFLGKEDFQQLLEATSKLRKEQEEEAMLNEKLREQQQQLEWCEGNLLAAQQRLLDARKVTASDISGQEMLKLLKADVKKNREFCNERIGRELTEKVKRLEQVEQLINEPLVSQNDIDSLNNDVRTLQREVQLLEEKANNSKNPEDDKLSVYKQQAAAVSKKKEKELEKLKNLENEESKLEKKMNQKEKEYESVKGGNKFVSRDELAKYAQTLRVKKNTYEQLKSQLKDIRNELSIVTRTEQLLKGRADEEMRIMMAIEREHGIEGFGEYKEALEQVSSIKQEIDLKKGTTLEEISKVVAEINYRITESRAKISPIIEESKKARARLKEVSAEYDSKKAVYDSECSALNTEKSKLEEELANLIEETTSQETKYHLLHAKIQLADSQLKRITTEQSCRNGEKKFSSEFNSLFENYSWKLQQQTKLMSELRNHQKSLKENHENSSRQVKMFSDLRKLLSVKAHIVEEEVGDKRNALRGKDLGGDIGVGGVNRLVLGD
jgi:intraflagellar transport protein 81